MAYFLEWILNFEKISAPSHPNGFPIGNIHRKPLLLLFWFVYYGKLWNWYSSSSLSK